MPYPWRCLCLGLVQMMRTTPLRLTTLHFSHKGLTDALTFMLVFLAFRQQKVYLNR
jgi:hypothetical protein